MNAKTQLEKLRLLFGKQQIMHDLNQEVEEKRTRANQLHNEVQEIAEDLVPYGGNPILVRRGGVTMIIYRNEDNQVMVYPTEIIDV